MRADHAQLSTHDRVGKGAAAVRVKSRQRTAPLPTLRRDMVNKSSVFSLSA
jgi:hypothetical protein